VATLTGLPGINERLKTERERAGGDLKKEGGREKKKKKKRGKGLMQTPRSRNLGKP
jgi:hypothetical protein